MKDLNDIALTLSENNHQLLKVGGCVRDKLLGRQNHDVDLVTDAKTDYLMKLFSTSVDAGGAKFGIVVIPTEKETYEVASFREDSKSVDHRHPEFVRFSSIEKDAFRRDFTINALYENMDGNIIDPTGKGKQDIKDHILRFCTESSNEFEGALERINEDHLRILRAFRFLAVLPNFDFSYDTGKAIQRACKDKTILDDIAWERIGQELRKLVEGKRTVYAIELMKQCGLLQIILPEVCLLEKVPQSEKWHQEGNVYNHTLMVVDKCEGDYLDKIACLLHDVGKFATLTISNKGDYINPSHDELGYFMSIDILKRLKFSNEEINIISTSIKWHMILKELSHLKKSVSWSMIQSKYFSHALAVAIADEKGKICNSKFTTMKEHLDNENVQFMLHNPLPDPLVTGEDLINLGLKPNKDFKRKLDVAYRVQLDNNWTKEQIMKQIKSW